MVSTQPRIANRFPQYRELILRKCNEDATIADLCQDYDCVVEAIEAIERTPGFAHSPDNVQHALLKLANELEKELLDRLGPSRTQGCNTRA